jgi:peroxin-3
MIDSSFTQHLLPETFVTSDPSCPLSPSNLRSPHLQSLLDQTRNQLDSVDAQVLLQRGIHEMVRSLVATIRIECYAKSLGIAVSPVRLVNCLPAINGWAKGVWEGIPDHGVEVRSTCLALMDINDRLCWRCPVWRVT